RGDLLLAHRRRTCTEAQGRGLPRSAAHAAPDAAGTSCECYRSRSMNSDAYRRNEKATVPLRLSRSGLWVRAWVLGAASGAKKLGCVVRARPRHLTFPVDKVGAGLSALFYAFATTYQRLP